MSRNFVALTILALAGTLLVMPEPSIAGPGGMRGGFAAGGLRAPMIFHPNARAGILRALPRVFPRAAALPGGHAFVAGAGRVHGPAAHGFARRTVGDLRSNFVRRHRREVLSGWIYPITTDDESAYIGTPYDPAEAIPVYAPPLVADEANPPPAAAPRLSNAAIPRDENQDACRSERVTVPESKGDGEREIVVVRC